MLSVDEGRLDVGRSQVEAALAIHRDTGERAEEGIALVNLAGIDQAVGRFDDARANLVGLLCVRVRLELACGDRATAQALLDGASRGAEALRPEPGSQTWTEIAALRAAIPAGDAVPR